MNIKKRYLLVLLFSLFLISVTSASAVVTIIPATPYDSDDLYCLVNGVVCNSAIACNAHWTSTGFPGQLVINPLSNVYTTQLTIVTCNAWIATPFGSQLAGTSSVAIYPNPPPPPPPPANTPPVLTGRIPDYTILRNSGLNDNLVPLFNFATDAETPVNQLTFSITAQTNTPIVNCVIHDQRNNLTNPGVFVDCTPQLNQIGFSDITVRVTDGGNLWAEDVFRVNVVGAGNTPPTLMFLPDVTIAEDSGLNMNLINLWNYASDAETPDDQLVFTITSETGLTISDCSIRNNQFIECLTLLNQNGISDVTVQVTDQGGLTTSDTFRVTVTPVNDAPIVSNIPDVTLYEDLPNTALPPIDLDIFVSDPDGDNVTWTATSSTPNLNIVINPDNSVTFNPVLNWFGNAVVNFTARDSSGLLGSDVINVVVYPVNDLPIFSGIPNLTFAEDFGTADNAIDLRLYASDIETPVNQLLFSVVSQSAPGIVDCRLDSNRYIDCTSQQDQNGISDVVIQVSDGIGNATSSFRITVTPVNDIPTINPLIPDQIRDEDSNPWSFDLTPYGHDIEDAQTILRWSVAGVNTALFNATFDVSQRVITFTPVANACGSNIISLTVRDTNGTTASQNVNVTLNCINDLPWINPVIPDQTRNEDALPWTLDLTNYGHDIEDASTNLIWSVSGINTNLFNASINNRIITFTPVANASGVDSITLTVTDLNGGVASQNILVTLNPVNDIPWISPLIPNQVRDEGALPWGIDLRLYENDVEDNTTYLRWNVSGVDNSLLTIDIDSVTHIATFILNNSDVYGTNTVTFTLTDFQGASVSQNVLITINSVNDAPIVSDIPNVNFDEDTVYTTTWNLNDFVNDVDNLDSQITWSVIGNTNISVTINPNRTVTFTPDPNWNGAESLTFRATDVLGLYDEDVVLVSVNPLNDAPIISNIPDVTIPEDGVDFSIDLDNYVNDPDHLDSQISWTFTGEHNIIVNIDPVTHIVILTPLPDWFGQEIITFRACDPYNLCVSDNSTVTVTSVDDAPVVSDIPNINFNEDGNYTLDLNQYVSDIDNTDAQIIWSVSGDLNLIVSINASNVAFISAPADWNGVETLNFSARDPSGLSDSDISMVLVNAINDAPTISPVIPNQIRNEDDPAWSLDLTNYGHDVEDSQTSLRWSVSGVDTTMYTTSFDAAQRIITFTPIANACGVDNITLSVIDLQSAVISQDILVTLNCRNDDPVVSNIPNVQLEENSAPVTLIQLDNFVSDIETPDANITWTYSPTPSNINITINPITHSVTFGILTPNWNGNETVVFQACDSGLPQLCASDSVTIIVTPVNNAPVVTDIPNRNITEDSIGTITLDSYVSDIDNLLSDISWSVNGNTNIIVSINPVTHVATISAPANWTGQELLNFSACDIGLLCDSDISLITFTPVNDIPMVDMPGIITMNEDSVISLPLGPYVTDVDNSDAEINWSSAGSANIAVTIDNVNKIATFTPNANWSGMQSITFTATDLGGLSASGTLNVNVTPINDPPMLTSFSPASPVTINEGSSQTFSVVANDIDGPNPLTYAWTLDGVIIPGATANSYLYNATNGPSAHNLVVVISDGVTSINQPWTININNVPPSGVSAGGPYSCAIGRTVQLTGSATDPVDSLTYSWDFYNDGSIDVTGQTVFFPCALAGLHNIRLSVSDGITSVNATTTVRTYDIRLNEFYAFSSADWVELYNNDPVNAFTLNNWILVDSTSTMATISGQTILPHGFLIVNVASRLNLGGDDIKLYDNLGNLIDSYTYTTTANITTEGRIPDGNGAFVLNIPTPGSTNIPLGANQPPVAEAGAPQGVITGSLVNLNGNGSYDPNGDAISYLWTINSKPVGSNVTINNNLTMTPTFTPDVNGVYVIQLRVTDNPLVPPQLSNTDVVVITASITPVNNPPVITSIDVIPTTANINGLLACVVSASDPDGNPVTINYAWSDSNPAVNLGSFTSSILNLTLVPNEAGGDVITCTATPNDGIVNGTSWSDTASISSGPVNNPPVITSIDVIPSTIAIDGTLNCATSTFDADGNSVTVSYAWTINNPAVNLSSFTTNILNLSLVSGEANGNIITCTATPNDGITNGIPGSDTATIASSPINNPPVINSVNIIPDPATIDNTLTCNATASDIDGNPITFSYIWTTTGGQDLSAFTSSVLPLSLIVGEGNGDIINCSARAYDGIAYSAPGSDTVTIIALAANLSGIVRDGINNNIYNATVEVRKGGITIASATTSDLTNIGYYLVNLLTGTYDIVISKAGFVTTTVSNLVINGGANTQNINLVESATSGRLSGSVRDMLNNPITNAQVRIKNSANQTIQLVQSDSFGNYIITGLPTSTTYNLEAQKTGYTFAVGPINVGVIASSTVTDNNIFMS